MAVSQRAIAASHRCRAHRYSVRSVSVPCAERVRTRSEARPCMIRVPSAHDADALRTMYGHAPHTVPTASAHQAENELKTAPSVSRPVCKIIGIMINRIFKNYDISSLGIGIRKAVYASIFGCLRFDIQQIILRHSDVYVSTFGRLRFDIRQLMPKYVADGS